MKILNLAVSYYVTVACLETMVKSCMEGELRLIGEQDSSSGQVLFCYDKRWVAVCDDEWSENAALVVCRQLGLPTQVVSALRGFGNGSGELLIHNVDCSGNESRFDECIMVVENNDCKLFHYNGVSCYATDTSCEKWSDVDDPPQCNESNSLLQSLPSLACVQEYGTCGPFYPATTPTETLCDDLYEVGIDYVYLPKNRNDGNFAEMMSDIVLYGDQFLKSFTNCYEEARLVLCHYYLPPCGNSTVFKPPTAVCPKHCKQINIKCPDEWADFVVQAESSNPFLEQFGVQTIDCNYPGQHLSPLSFCCSDAGLNTTDVSSSNDSEKTPQFIGVSVGTVAGLLLIVVVLIIIYSARRYFKRKRHLLDLSQRKQGKEIDSVSPALESGHYTHIGTVPTVELRENVSHRPRVLSGFIRKMSDDELLLPERCIDLNSIVGQGEFGIVYRGTLSNWKGCTHDLVAIKTLKGNFNSNDLKKLAEESQIMARFDHPHVMTLLGVAISQVHQTLYIVMPYMAQGSLLSYLRRHRADLTVGNEEMRELIMETGSKLLSVSLQISKGMKYLASEMFIHRDLAARNCMIDSNNVIKVADFGLSEDIYSKNYFRQGSDSKEEEDPVKLPVRWMALESLNDGIFNEKTDVWSFGVTCWEVFSLGKNPYPGVDPFSLIRYLERGERLDKPLNAACSQEIYEIMKQCWDREPEQRLTFSELVTVISTSLESMSGYLQLDFITPSITAEKAE